MPSTTVLPRGKYWLLRQDAKLSDAIARIDNTTKLWVSKEDINMDMLNKVLIPENYEMVACSPYILIALDTDVYAGTVSTRVQKLLDISLIKLTAQTKWGADATDINPVVQISMEKYMNDCGLSGSKQTKYDLGQQVKKDLLKITALRIHDERATDEMWQKLYTSASYENQCITFEFSPYYLRRLSEKPYFIHIPEQLLKLNSKHRNAYCIGRVLSTHYFNPSYRRAKKHNVISIKELLSSAYCIPDVEEVGESNRAYSVRIIKVLNHALDVLARAGILHDSSLCLLDRSFSKKEVEWLDKDKVPWRQYLNWYLEYIIPELALHKK
jgi:hypothetical protein